MNDPNTRIKTIRPLIEAAYAALGQPGAQPLTGEQVNVIEEVIGYLNRGRLRICTFENGAWVTHAWLKQAVLLYFRSQLVEEIELNPFTWADRIPIKRWKLEMGVRVVPPAVVRNGAFVAKGAVLMPSYINIGAFVDEGTMVDTWATVGSCAQIGKNVHLSGGVGIGGVLEPPQAQPVIIEDDCFIGSRCIVVEGVVVKKAAVLGAGVTLTQSTPIVDVTGPKAVITKGMIPENSVVIPGTIPKEFPAGTFQVPCAMIIGKRSASTDRKTSLNQVLREFEVPV